MTVTVKQVLTRYPGAVAFRCRDGPALNAEIMALVRAGAKTVSCEAWDAFAARGAPLPQVGRVDIPLDWAGALKLAVRTVAVETLRFCDMDDSRIPPQGEFADLEHWRREYKAYLRRSGCFAWGAPMVMETFELVEEFGIP